MKFKFHQNLLLFIFILFFTGCGATRNTHKVGFTPIMKAQKEIPEDQLMDVGIQVFGSEEMTEKQAKEEITNSEIRKAEGHFIPYHLKNTLQQSSYWGAVGVLPAESNSIDVQVTGKILESSGERLVLQIDVTDATRKIWFSKKYESEATPAFYSGNQSGEKDAYQDLYNTISNDMAAYRLLLTDKAVENIHIVSKLKFAEDLVPSAYNGYLAMDKNDVINVNRLPADEDPMMDRMLKIREREYMYVDTLNAYYEVYYNEMRPSYDDWRKLNYQEIKALKKIKREGMMRKLAGVLLIAGAIALDVGDVSNTGVLQTSMILIGGQVIVDGFNVSREAEIHSAAIQELSESFGSEMQPVVMEFEDKQYELTGSAEEQFARWRELLRQIYFTETGFDADVPLENEKERQTEDPE
jgi:hypothetical protein